MVGARHGSPLVVGIGAVAYLLLWVVLGANLMAMLIQSMSAKLGIATGKNLPEARRMHAGPAASCGGL